MSSSVAKLQSRPTCRTSVRSDEDKLRRSHESGGQRIEQSPSGQRQHVDRLVLPVGVHQQLVVVGNPNVVHVLNG